MEQEIKTGLRFYWGMMRQDDGSLLSLTTVAHPLISGPGKYNEQELDCLTKAFHEITPGIIIPADYSTGKKMFEEVNDKVMKRYEELKNISNNNLNPI